MKVEEIVIDGKRYSVSDTGIDAVVDDGIATVFAGAIGIKIKVECDDMGKTCGSYYPMDPS